jgi:multidrug resistance protein, MATE family
MIVLIAGVVANAINIFLTYGMVHGVWGMPKLGIAGSAVGTVVATALELSIPLAVFLGPKLNRLYGTRRAWRPSTPHIRDIVRIGWASGLMFGNEMICWAIFMVYFVGWFGPLHTNSGWIAHQYMALSFMPTVGISVAITAMVGKCLGAGRPDLAKQRAYVGIGVAIGYMMLCGVCFVIFREPMIRLFIHEDTSEADVARIIELGSWMLILTAGFQFFDAIAMTTSAALRGAGDTVVPGLATVVVSWVTIVLGGWAAVEYLPHWESLGPWAAASLYIIVLCGFLSARFLQGRWLKMKLLEHSAPVEAEAESVSR